MKRIIPIIFLFLSAALAFGQDASSEPVVIGYVISSVEFEIKGATQEFVLRGKADIPLGKTFSTRQELEAFLADRQQVLVNERVLADAQIVFELGEVDASRRMVHVRVMTNDSWNIVALPYFKYDSNSGLVLSARGRDYNFLGSMRTLVLNFDFFRDQLDRNGFEVYSTFGVPISWGTRVFNVGLSEEFTLYGDGTPFADATGLTLSLDDEFFGVPVSFGMGQSLSVNPDGVDNDPDPYFLSSSIFASAAIPLASEVWGLGALDYQPSANLSLAWRPEAAVREDRRGAILNLGQSLVLGRADWIGNMRRGFIANLRNTDSARFKDGSWTVDFDASVTAYLEWEGIVSLKARAQGFARPVGDARTDLGASLRGVRDARISGYSGLFVNLDLPTRLFSFPTHLLIGKNWLDFDLQASPFLDAAYVTPDPTALQQAESFWSSGGLEFLVFPLRMRSFIVRASLGFDLVSVLQTRSLTAHAADGWATNEVYLGLGVFY